jgi:hypothetical protein
MTDDQDIYRADADVIQAARGIRRSPATLAAVHRGKAEVIGRPQRASVAKPRMAASINCTQTCAGPIQVVFASPSGILAMRMPSAISLRPAR